MFNLQFFRLGRGIMLINIMLFSYVIANSKVTEARWLYSLFGALILLLMLFYYTFFIGDHIEDIIFPFFNEDSILNIYG